MFNEKCVYINKDTFDIVSEEPSVDNSENYFECDPMIAEGVSLLNKKGYKTLICCQGHIPRMSCGSLLGHIECGYVGFSEDVCLTSFPEYYYPMVLSVGAFDNCIVSDIEMVWQYEDESGKMCCFNEDDFKQRIVAQSKSFNEWTKMLPEYKIDNPKRL